MNWDQIQASWKQLKGRVKQGWGRLTHNAQTSITGTRERIDGKREQLAGQLKEKYVKDKAQSEKELDDFAKSLEPKESAPPFCAFSVQWNPCVSYRVSEEYGRPARFCRDWPARRGIIPAVVPWPATHATPQLHAHWHD